MFDDDDDDHHHHHEYRPNDLDFDSVPPPPPELSPHFFAADRARDRRCRRRQHHDDRHIYTKEKLNAEQTEIYRYMFDNPGAMVLIQAGPGTGKTFTMLTLAHAWEMPVNVIIYKHDLLHTFQHCANRYTVARFCMSVWELSFPNYVGLEHQLSGRMSARQFINVTVGLLRRAKMPNFGGSMVILDEYTVIPKPILFVLLMLLKRHRIGTVICGDKNQLQNIRNSVHAVRCSSYDIAAAFIDRKFTLTKNVRCNDAGYNDLVDYVSRYSCDKRLDRFGYALVAALFHRKFMTESAITDTHLASYHRDLAHTVHMMTVNTTAPVSFYFINASGVRDVSRVQGVLQPNRLYLPTVTVEEYMNKRAPGKYLPYVPLIVGCRYFVHTYSEHSQATLECVDAINETVAMRYDDNTLAFVRRENCNAVVFEKHRRYLLCSGDDDCRDGGVGQLYNYPIYLANAMSIHMCQGRTIRNNVDMILNGSTYQGFYVSMSRVTSPRQITRVIVPDIPSHLVSTVINFPQLCSPQTVVLTTDELDSCLSGGGGKKYMHYPLADAELTTRTMYLLGKFFASQNADERRRIRDAVCRSLENVVNPIVLAAPSPARVRGVENENNDTMALILRYKYAMLALSLVDERDSYVWIHEFIKTQPPSTVVRARWTTAAAAAQDTRFDLMRRVCCGAVDNGYEPNEDTLHYIVRHAEWKSAATVNPHHSRWHIVDTNETTNTVLETSQFRCAVYKHLATSSGAADITIVWLMDQLRLMVGGLPRATTVLASTYTADAAAAATTTTTTTTLGQLMDQSENKPTHVAYRTAPSFELKRFRRTVPGRAS